MYVLLLVSYFMKQNKIIFVFHSFKGGSGKTILAINLAYYLSQTLHKKVLLIDGDISAPTLKNYLVEQNESQLTWTDLLELDIDNVNMTTIQPHINSTSYTKLDIIFSPPPQLGKKFLSSKSTTWWSDAMKILFKSRDILLNDLGYDYIIIDNQSGIMFNSINNLILANITFLVVRPSKYEIDSIRDLLANVYQTVKSVSSNLWYKNEYILWNQIPFHENSDELNQNIENILDEWEMELQNYSITSLCKFPFLLNFASDMIKIGYDTNKSSIITDFFQEKITEICNHIDTNNTFQL